MKRLLTIALVFLSACASPAKKNQVLEDKATTDQSHFDKGLKALDDEHFEDAARIFDALLLEKPGTEMDLVTLFDSGVAYESMGQCNKAVDRYRKVVRSSAGKFKRLEAEALFRLSLAYECLGQDTKTITSLIDAKHRGKDLAYETLNAEIPARLAAAYSRLGNHTKALEYFNAASAGLKSIVARGGNQVKTDLLARTLYTMGKLSPTQKRGEANADTFLQSLAMQQPYLLQAMEFNRVPWSGKAEDDLKSAYRSVLDFKIADTEKQRQFYTRGLQTINELRKIRMNKPDAAIDSVFAQLDETETKLQNELSKVGATNPLTPSAEKREGLRRDGHLIDPKKPKDPAAQ